jgi:hypothetical protein
MSVLFDKMSLRTIKTTPLDNSTKKYYRMRFMLDSRATNRTAQKQLACIYVVSLLRALVLRSDVEIAQPPLQR